MSNQILLSIKIENKTPVELQQLTSSLMALSNQYDSFLRKNGNFDLQKSQRKLYISKLESGSIYIELLSLVVPLLNDWNTVLLFCSYLRNTYNFFLGKDDILDYKLVKTDYSQLSEIINLTATDNQGSINFSTKGDNNTTIIHINSTEANAIQNTIRRYKENILELPIYYSKELMYWANASFLKNQINDKVIIEKIDKKPKKVIFKNDQDKILATSHNNKFKDKNWQDLAYIVDVEVSYIEDIPKEYKITKLYAEEIFDPENEE